MEAKPNWPVQDLKTVLHNHLALTKSELVARLTADIAAFYKIHRQATMMSDELADGIILGHTTTTKPRYHI